MEIYNQQSLESLEEKKAAQAFIKTSWCQKDLQTLYQRPLEIIGLLWTTCTQHTTIQLFVYVVVNFLFQLIFIFPLFWGMVLYANEFKTKEKQKLTDIKN